MCVVWVWVTDEGVQVQDWCQPCCCPRTLQKSVCMGLFLRHEGGPLLGSRCMKVCCVC